MSFRLDRTAHHAGTHEQAAHYHASHQPATPAERLRAAAYLNAWPMATTSTTRPGSTGRLLLRVSTPTAMGSLFNPDFQDFLQALRLHEVRYVLVGGYSVIMHGYSRTIGILDLWVEKPAGNYERLTKAFHHFGMPVFDMTAHNFLQNPAWTCSPSAGRRSLLTSSPNSKGLNFLKLMLLLPMLSKMG
jgi:hypothetical protein